MSSRYATHLVVARMGVSGAAYVEVVSTRTTYHGPFCFRRIPNRGETGILRITVGLGGKEIPLVIQWFENNQIMIPVGDEIWVIVPVPGRHHARNRAQRWNSEYFEHKPLEF